MNVFLDKYSVLVPSLILKNKKWFSKSIESPTFKEHLNSINIVFPKIEGEGFYEIEAKYINGNADPAIHIVKWLGAEYPTIIYHHGNNEKPFDYSAISKNTFKSIILAKRESFETNIINIRAPFHNSGMKDYLEKMGNLSNFTGMLSVSVKLEEMLVQYLKEKGCKKVILTGISLGGWVTNLHRSYYNSGDIYIPIFAGAALDELFLSSYYRKLSSDLANANPNAIKNILNFEKEFELIKDENIYPLLARFDQIIEFDTQKKCYNDKSLSIIKKGHITGALASKDLRNHILNHIKVKNM